jgi:hypothetical protein
MNAMSRISITTRIAFGLACVTCTVTLSAQALGLFPDHRQDVAHGRLALCEALAVHASALARRPDTRQLEGNLKSIVSHNPDIVSVGLRRDNGRLLVAAGDHASHWQPSQPDRPSDSQMSVPITVAGRPWGKFEIAFAPTEQAGFWGWLQSKPVRLAAFMFCGSYLACLIYLHRMLWRLKPATSRVAGAT